MHLQSKNPPQTLSYVTCTGNTDLDLGKASPRCCWAHVGRDSHSTKHQDRIDAHVHQKGQSNVAFADQSERGPELKAADIFDRHVDRKSGGGGDYACELNEYERRSDVCMYISALVKDMRENTCMAN